MKFGMPSSIGKIAPHLGHFNAFLSAVYTNGEWSLGQTRISKSCFEIGSVMQELNA